MLNADFEGSEGICERLGPPNVIAIEGDVLPNAVQNFSNWPFRSPPARDYCERIKTTHIGAGMVKKALNDMITYRIDWRLLSMTAKGTRGLRGISTKCKAAELTTEFQSGCQIQEPTQGFRMQEYARVSDGKRGRDSEIYKPDYEIYNQWLSALPARIAVFPAPFTIFFNA